MEEDVGDSNETEKIVEEQVEVSGSKGITDFGLDDIKFDLGLCIPIDQYPPNIREDDIFAYLEKGQLSIISP